MDATTLPVHSVAEAHLYLMVTPCEACGKGPVTAAGARHGFADGVPVLDLRALCKACGHTHPLVIDLSLCDEDTDADVGPSPDHSPSETSLVNPSDEPSRIIDVAQWLVLFRVILDAASKASDRTEGRRLGYEAAQCLEEALKFYTVESEWPPPTAFFHDKSRERYEHNTQHYARQRLLDMRAKLPTLGQMQKQIDQPSSEEKKRWWQWWK